jgi:ABC-type polysaccharide/polyol phosphate export permease
VTRAASVFRSHANLVQRVRFPAEVLVIGNVAGTLLHHAVALVVVVAVCLFKGHLGLEGLPWALLGVVLWALWIVALSLAASLLGVALPDSTEVLALTLQLAFYGAPIIYSLSFVKHDVLRMLVEVNPLTPLVGVIRAGLTGAEPPSALALTLLGVGGVVLLAGAAAAMDRWRHSIPDLV